ncbi:MAG: CBS domain-containing protein [Chloroflexi bacterium]|nr:CBS domain-containing protein [Chloroflexota bacterium]
MRLILTHENADFDAIAALMAAYKLYPKAVPLLPRRVNRNVQQFLTLYWDAFHFTRPSDWQRRRVDEVLLVDTQALNSVRGMVKRPSVQVIDHHTDHKQHESWVYQVETVGATTTLLVEEINAQGLALSNEEATLLLLGIYEDTGSLTYDTTTPRDLSAASWLLDCGALLTVVRRFLNIPLTDAQYKLYDDLYTAVSWHTISGQSIVVTTATSPDDFREEVSSIAHRLREALTPAGLFILVKMQKDVQLVARSSTDKVDVSLVAHALGGGGHDKAAAARVLNADLTAVHDQLLTLLPQAVQPEVRVTELMSYGVQTVKPTATVSKAADLMRRFGHEGYPVVDAHSRQIVGLLTRRAVDRAMSHDLNRLPVSRIMKKGSVTVRPSDSINHLQQLMLAEGWGQIPVLAEDAAAAVDGPIGIVTRTDLLNHLFQPTDKSAEPDMRQLLLERLSPTLWEMVCTIGEAAAELNLPLYFVGGLVRDLLLGKSPTDLDMVVEGNGIKLARQLQAKYGGDVHAHKRFGTAKWSLDTAVWTAVLTRSVNHYAAAAGRTPFDLTTIDLPRLSQMAIDFVTARTEFYTEPSALPEVTHGSIKLDLHRRDFSINTLAVRLDGAFLGQLLDFYGGQRDLAQGLIRVLHSLSFVDDPTRILRAVRLEQRLNFRIEARSRELIVGALPLLGRVSGARIRHELELAFQEQNQAAVLSRLAELDVLAHVHEALTWQPAAAAAFDRLRPLRTDPIWQDLITTDTQEFAYFALWMQSLPETAQSGVMARLRVRKATRADVLACGRMTAVLQNLPLDARPSQVEKALRPYPSRVLLVIRAWLQDERLIDIVEKYYGEWREVKTAVSGNDLRQMGLKPGPKFAVLLDRLLAARLDGEVKNETEERALLEKLIR